MMSVMFSEKLQQMFSSATNDCLQTSQQDFVDSNDILPVLKQSKDD